jgi:hypothetical protein
MKATLKKLLDRLDAISKDHEEVGDTDVREQMFEAVYHAFIIQTPRNTLPTKFGMFESAGDAAVRAALSEFIPGACNAGLSTPQERFAAFQDGSVLSDASNPYDEYFGHLDSFDELSAVMSRPSTPTVTPPAKPWWQFWK